MPGPFPSSGGGDEPGVVVGNHGYAFSLIVRASGLETYSKYDVHQLLDIVVLTESLPRWIANTGVFMELVSCPQQQNIAFAPPFRGWTDLYAMSVVSQR